MLCSVPSSSVFHNSDLESPPVVPLSLATNINEGAWPSNAGVQVLDLARGIVVHLDDISNAVPPPSLPLIQTSAHIPFPTARTVALAAVCAGALIIVLVLLSRRGGRRCSRTRFPRPDSEPVGQGYVLHESDASSEEVPMTAVNWSTRSARGPESNFTHNKSS